MTSRLAEKSCKVVVVDPSGPVRQMMTEVARATLGFEKVEGKASVQDLVQFLEIDTCDWAFVPLMADQPVNALHLLKLCSDLPELKNVRISLLLEESERYLLPWAYELGLLSHHTKPFTKETLTEEFGKLKQLLESTKFQEPLIAGSHFRKYLQAAKLHDIQITLEKSLLNLYPGESEILLHLAEPQALGGKKDDAVKTLTLTKSVHPELSEKVDELAKNLLGPETTINAASAAGGGLNMLGINDCVVVDHDEASSKAVGEILSGMGVKGIRSYADGETAWQEISKGKEPDLIIMEWKIRKLSGPLLLQRLRHHGFNTVPVIVLSSLLKPTDMPLVREMSVATIIAKPLNRESFVPSLIWTIRQERLPTEHQVMERKLRGLLHAHKLEEAEPLRAQFLADPNVPLTRKRLVEAEHAFASGNYPLTRDAAADSIRLNAENVIALNLLGKAFIHLKDPATALKCFRRAEHLSPNNIERICAIAESESDLGNTEAANQALDAAKALDPDSKNVIEAETKVAIASGDTSTAKEVMARLDPITGLVAYMNNKAVAHAKCGFTDDAIDLYRKTVASIPDDAGETKNLVQYNLGLAMARAGDLEGSIKELKIVSTAKNPKLVKKAASLEERVKKALATGSNLVLLTNDASGSTPANANANGNGTGTGAQAPSANPQQAQAAATEKQPLVTESEAKALMAKVEARPGDLCCYLLYEGPQPRDVRVDALLSKPPRFQIRDAIARAEALGAERAIKGAS